MKTIEELKRNKNDVQGAPSPWFDSDEVDELIDSAVLLGKEIQYKSDQEQFDAFYKDGKIDGAKEERERIVGVIDERIELCSKTNRNAEKEGLQKIKKTILTTDSEVKNTNETSEAQNDRM